MQIHGDEYTTLVIVDKENNLLCCFNDTDAITSTGVKVLTEQQLGELAFLPMENETVKCFVRSERSVFPKGSMNTEQFYEYNTSTGNNAEESTDKEKEEQNGTKPQENNSEVLGLAQLFKNIPKEAITQFVNGMTQNINKEAGRHD